MFNLSTILFSLTVMCTYFMEGIVGFGATIFALPILTAFTAFKTAVPVMTNMGIAAPAFIAIRDRKFISRSEFLKIFKIMLLGLPVGMLSFSLLPERTLKLVLGLFMIFVAVKNTSARFSKKTAADNVHPKMKYLYYALIFFGGIMQGAFSSGGPFVVIYASKFIPDKTEFRATLQALWLSMNCIVLVKNIIFGFITPQVLLLTLFSIPFAYLALYFGNIVHKKIKGEQFAMFVNIVLLLAGLLMMRK